MPGWRDAHPISSLRQHAAGGRELRERTKRELSARIAKEQATSRLPSLNVGLVRDGRVLWCEGAGEVDGEPPSEETQYRCGSISKTFVAVGVMRLRDEGALDLADPIGRHLPSLPLPDLTIAQLLSHTSGLRAETAGPWWERTPGIPFDDLAATSIRVEDALARPGRRFHYSNTGFGVLGQLIATLRGSSWDEVVDDELLRPLGMVRTTTRPVAPAARGFGVHPHADVLLAEPEHDAVAMAPAGQLWSTVEDLGRWSTLLSGQHPKVLRPETAAEMREVQAVADMPDEAWTAGYGLGLQLWNNAGVRRYGHGGSMPGFLAALVVDESSSDAAVVMTNATSGLDMTLPGDLLRMLSENEPRTMDPWKPSSDVDGRVLELTGPWYWGTTALVLSVKGDGSLQLDALRAGRESAFRRLDADGDLYVGLYGYYAGERLRVVRHADGSLSHLDIGSFVLTRTPYDPAAEVPGGVDPAGWRAQR
jgi:CubicO group peptidase (beta-lactamase class C family)